MAAKVRKVIVIGGGIGGLTVANCLQKCGIAVKVYERAPKLLPEVGSGIGIWHPALLVLRQIGLEDTILDKGRLMQSAGYTTIKGAWLARPSPDFHESSNRVVSLRRGDVISALEKALAPGIVHTNHTFESFTQNKDSVTVKFADGKTEECDYLIGADGMHSNIRKQLFGDILPMYCGYTTYRAILNCPFPENNDSFETWGPSRRFAAVPLKGESLFWYAAIEGPAKSFDNKGKKETLLKELQGWHHPIADFIKATDEATILQTDIYETPKMPEWGKGRVMLLGDACHSTAPTLAQGACLAMEDAAELAYALTKYPPTSEELVKYYYSKRQFRARVVQNMSRWIARIGQVESPILRHSRDILMRITPDFLMTPAFNTVLRFCLGWNYAPPNLGKEE